MATAVGQEISFHPKQVEVFTCPSPRKVIVAGRGFGKTRYAAGDAIAKVFEEVNWCGRVMTVEDEVMYVAPTFTNGMAQFWPIVEMIAGGHVDNGGLISHVDKNAGVMTFVNGVRLRVRGMDNMDRGRGFILRHAIMDEYADMDPEAWRVIIGPAVMKTNGTVTFIGTPKRGRPHFADLYLRAKTSQVNPKYGFPLWAGFQYASADNPWLDPEAIAEFGAEMSDERRAEELQGLILPEGGNYLDADWWRFENREPEDGYYVVVVDPAGFTAEAGRADKSRRDNTAIAIVKICRIGWWVREIQYGRWDIRRTALNIARAAAKVQARSIGIEKGVGSAALSGYLPDLMHQFGLGRKIEYLSHGNKHKEDRILGALEGRLQRGRIALNCDPALLSSERPAWIQKLIHEATEFPSKFSHDDLLDALAYTDQMGKTIFHTFNATKQDTWQPLDVEAGI